MTPSATLEALSKFLERADERYANTDEVGELVQSSLETQGVLTSEDLGDLTQDEMDSIIGALSDPVGGSPDPVEVEEGD